MCVVICPGMHDVTLTQSFVLALGQHSLEFLVFPSDRLPAYSTPHIFHFLHHQLSNPLSAHSLQDAIKTPLLFIGFSAGVVGAIGAAHLWQWFGGRVKALIAIDGWGVPLYGNFPIHRLSHDAFTHWSTLVLGNGSDSFYADPGVPHLELWRSPQSVQGWCIHSQPDLGASSRFPTTTTAERFLLTLLSRYQEL